VERRPAGVEVRRRLEQPLVRRDLTGRGEQQRGHRLGAAHPVLCHVLPAQAHGPLGQVLLVDLRGCVTQRIGDDRVRLEEGPQHGPGDHRPLGPQQHVDLFAARRDMRFPVLVP